MTKAQFHERIARAYEQCANDPTVAKKDRGQAAENAKRAQRFAAIAKAEEHDNV